MVFCGRFTIRDQVTDVVMVVRLGVLQRSQKQPLWAEGSKKEDRSSRNEGINLTCHGLLRDDDRTTCHAWRSLGNA